MLHMNCVSRTCYNSESLSLHRLDTLKRHRIRNAKEFSSSIWRSKQRRHQREILKWHHHPIDQFGGDSSLGHQMGINLMLVRMMYGFAQNVQGANNERLIVEEFTLFPSLPKELRLKIFRTAQVEVENNVRVVEITYERSIQQLVSLSFAPPLLSVSIEAREEALKVANTLNTPPEAPKIYINVEHDYLFIREDSDGVLSNHNTLLRAILGDRSDSKAPMSNLSSVKNLAIDFWVSSHAYRNLRPLQSIRYLENLVVVMADSEPRAISTTYKSGNNQAREPPYPRKTPESFTNVGFMDHDIQSAVEKFWGLSKLHWGFGDCEENVRDVVQHYLVAEMEYLKRRDRDWICPEFDFVTYGRY